MNEIGPINDPKDIPADLGDEEQIEFLIEHGVSEQFLENAEEVPAEERPRPRQSAESTDVLLDDFTRGRLEALAGRRNVGYQTLAKQFVAERLYQEELREGVLPPALEGSDSKPSELAKEQTTSAKKPRDWQSWAYSFAKDNEELLSDPDVDSITLSRLAEDASSRLLELSGEIKQASTKEGFPATQIRRMMKGYERLKSLTERVIELYGEKFGEPEDDEGQTAGSGGVGYDVIREAERILHQA